MTNASTGRTTGARVRRLVGVVAAVVVVTVPMLVGLVLAWRVHPLLVLPAYLVGIPAWLTLVSGAWALVRRVRPARQEREEPVSAGPVDQPCDRPGDQRPDQHVGEPGAQEAPRLLLSSEIRLPAPRRQTAAAAVRTPTP